MKIYANGTQAIEYVVKNSVDIMQRYDGLMETKAREIVRSVVRAYEVDWFLGTVQLVRNSRELARAMMFETGQFDSQFVNIVSATSAMHTLGDYSETGFGRKNVSDDERRAHDTLSKLRLGLNVASVSIDAAYTEFRKYNQLVRTGLTDDAAKRAASVVTAAEAKSQWLRLARDVVEAKPNIAYSQAAGNWMDAIAVVFEYDCRTQKHIGGEREWEPIAKWLKNLRRIPAIDMGEFVADKFPGQVALLRYIDQQMSRMNYEHAAACALAWADELAELRGYVSRETLFGLKRRCE